MKWNYNMNEAPMGDYQTIIKGKIKKEVYVPFRVLVLWRRVVHTGEYFSQSYVEEDGETWFGFTKRYPPIAWTEVDMARKKE